MYSLGGKYQGLVSTKKGTCSVPYWEQILYFGRFITCQPGNLPVYLGYWNFEKPRGHLCDDAIESNEDIWG